MAQQQLEMARQRQQQQMQPPAVLDGLLVLDRPLTLRHLALARVIVEMGQHHMLHLLAEPKPRLGNGGSRIWRITDCLQQGRRESNKSYEDRRIKLTRHPQHHQRRLSISTLGEEIGLHTLLERRRDWDGNQVPSPRPNSRKLVLPPSGSAYLPMYDHASRRILFSVL